MSFQKELKWLLKLNCFLSYISVTTKQKELIEVFDKNKGGERKFKKKEKKSIFNGMTSH